MVGTSRACRSGMLGDERDFPKTPTTVPRAGRSDEQDGGDDQVSQRTDQPPKAWSGREELKHRHREGGCSRAVPLQNQALNLTSGPQRADRFSVRSLGAGRTTSEHKFGEQSRADAGVGVEIAPPF